MHTEVQLEINLEDKTTDEMKIYLMQKKIDEVCESMGKVRRKIFADLGEMKRLCVETQQENRELRETLKKLTGQREEWVYLQDGWLFDLKAS